MEAGTSGEGEVAAWGGATALGVALACAAWLTLRPAVWLLVGISPERGGSKQSTVFSVCLQDAEVSVFLIPMFIPRIVFLSVFASKVKTN